MNCAFDANQRRVRATDFFNESTLTRHSEVDKFTALAELTGHLTDGSPNVTIQHIIREDEPHPIFPNDPAAWAHVVKQARDGSHLHIQALDLACRIERLGIEASCGTW